MSVGFVALYALFMGWADLRQAGVDFTLFQCMDSLITMAGGLGAGVIAEHSGYAAFFLAAAGVSTLAAPLLVLLVRERRSQRPAAACPRSLCSMGVDGSAYAEPRSMISALSRMRSSAGKAWSSFSVSPSLNSRSSIASRPISL